MNQAAIGPGAASEDLRVAAPGGVAFELVSRVARRATRRALFGSEEPAVRVGRYELVRAIGSGGMGVVFLATDPELERTVALKIVHPLLGDADSERTRAEARFTAQLSHPNVVQVYDLGTHAGQLFIAMEYVEGETLDAWLGAGARSADEICSAFLQAAEGLAAVHAGGIVHRDFKPSNVIVGTDGRVRIADFGLADLPLRDDPQRAGTPRFAAPEQLAGAQTDRRADVYAFAQSLHLALTGSFYEGALADVPPRLAKPLRMSLKNDVESRAADLTPLIEALSPPESRRRWMPLALVAAILALAVAFVLRDNPLYEGVPDDPFPAEAPAVLWIDDNPRYNKKEIAAMHAMGLRVVTAVSLEEARRAGPLSAYVAVLSDMERLDEAGYDLNGGLAVIRAVRAEGADTPVYIYTSERLVPVMTPTVAAAGGNGVTGTPKRLLELVRQAAAR